MKTILSWDVGIKNLAYCMIQKIDDNTGGDFKILKWGVINLNDDQQKCQFELKTGNKCQENAKLCIYHRDKISLFDKYENGVMFVCSKHKTKTLPVMEKIENLTKKKKNKKNKDNEDNLNFKCCYNCNEKPIYNLTTTNFCWCEEHYEKKGKSFAKKVHAKKHTVTTCSKQPIQDLAEKLFERLDLEFKDFGDISEILIENQPTLTNPKMKTLASFLYSYFVMRGITDKIKTKSKIEEVRFVSPSNKLKVNPETSNLIKNEKDKNEKDKNEKDKNEKDKNEKDKDTKKNIYKLTKSLGVKYCRAIITKEDDNIIEQIKKKDDMCDAFLQGFQYLFSPVPEKFFKKLEKIGFELSKDKPENKKSNNKNDNTNK